MTREDRLVVRICLLVLLSALLYAATPVHAEPYLPSVAEVRQIVLEAADHFGLPRQRFLAAVHCESDTHWGIAGINTLGLPRELDPLAIGDHGKAEGLAQLREDGMLPTFRADPRNTDHFDPRQAANFMASHIAAGSRAWSCW